MNDASIGSEHERDARGLPQVKVTSNNDDPESSDNASALASPQLCFMLE